MKELLLNNCRLDARYDIRENLGRGSYAEIYVARDILASPNAPHALVVIKALNVFLQDDLDVDLERTLVENFQKEAIALDRVRHPNIISRLGHGTARDLRGTVFHYLVLEYLPGGDLAKLSKNRKLGLNEVFDYLEQVCAGLGHAHERGIIHRDIKPQNLLLTKDLETVKIADFGVARVSQGNEPITRVGTNMYAPPEHSPLFNEAFDVVTVTELTPAADIYSLAKSTYALVTGDSPRKFTSMPITELPLSFDDKSWSAEFLAILRKATQNNPQARYQTVQDFWQDLVKVKTLADAENTETETKISTRLHLVPQASVSADFSPQTPLKPKFNTSRELKIESSLISEESPRLVVKLNDTAAKNTVNAPVQKQENKPPFQPPKTAPQIFTKYEEPRKDRPFLRRSMYFLLFITLFAGALFVTQNYLRTGRIFPSISNPFVKPEGIATIDINLRSGAGVDNQIVGTVPKGSRVRILDTKTLNTGTIWAEIDIIQFSRDKINPDDAEHGWVNQKYLDIQE